MNLITENSNFVNNSRTFSIFEISSLPMAESFYQVERL